MTKKSRDRRVARREEHQREANEFIAHMERTWEKHKLKIRTAEEIKATRVSAYEYLIP
jgi:hypothetical protein